MKIIKKGSGQKGWSKECTCTGYGNGNGGCGAVLLVEQADLYQTSRQCYGDDYPEYFTTFKCVECGVETDILKVPGNITKDLPSKEQWLLSQR